MPTGYLVSLGGNNALNGGDTISGGTVTFTTQTSLGTGQWVWSGTAGGTTYTNTTEPGRYYLATDGNVYFVPDYGPVDTLTVSSVVTSPTFAPTLGTSGDDTLTGTTGNDTIYGGPSTGQTGTGNDSINGGNGNDVIFAGDGNDTLQGGSGADTLYGGAGMDTASYSASGSAVNVNLATGAASGGNANGDVLNSIEGVVGSGFNDTLTGSSEANYIDGGAGADAISAGDGNDTVLGGDGNDTIDGGSGDDSVSGGLGNDSILGGAGSDTIDGGSGTDFITGGDGADSLLGGDGNDTIYGGSQPVASTQEHLNWIGQGTNGTNIAGGFTQDTGGMNVTAGFANNGGNTAIQTSNTTQYVGGSEPFAANSGLYLTGNSGPNSTTTLTFNAEAGSGLTNQVSNVSFRINDIDMQGWQDIITVTAFDVNGNPVTVNFTMTGNDTVSGNTITAANSSDSASSANGSALISIPGPVHSIQIAYSNGGTSSQALWITNVHYTTVPAANPGDGADTIDGGTGADLIHGQTGDDTINLTGTFGNDTITGGETGETAGDVVNATALTQNTMLNFTGNEAGTLSDGTSTASFSEIERFQLGSGADTVNAAATTAGVNVDGGAGNDSMTGGSGADTLAGGSGNDTLNGGAGADSLTGGAGDDTFRLTGTFGNDTITGGETSESAGDRIDATGLTGPATLTFTGNEAGTLSSGGSTATFSQIEQVSLGSGADTVNAAATTAGVNVDGGTGADSMTGGSGADTLAGGSGNDTLNGGAGNDSLTGGAGADRITGGSGDDTIDLGLNDGAADIVDLDDGSGSDIIRNFTAPTDNGNGTYTGYDQFDVSDLTDAGGNPIKAWDVTVTDTVGDGTGDAILTFPNGESVTLVGVAPSQVDSYGELVAMGIPCFTRGARIATPDGEVAVEDLRAGDSVWTLDNGAQTIRWIGSKRVAAIGPLAPVLIPEGTLGNSRDIRVSPQHRMLISGWQAELFFGEAEVLVAAKHLVDGSVIRSVPGGEVEYFHILFDRHEIVLADGAPSESFHPGDQGLAGLGEATRAELLTLFPELEMAGSAGYGPAARRSLKAHEAALLRLAQPGNSAVPAARAVPA